MNGYDAYKIFQAVRLHFTSKKFDYFTYNGKSKTSLDTFNMRKDKYLYHKIARMYDEDELPYFFAINFTKGDKQWINSMLNGGDETYKEWKKWQQSRLYNFTNDVEKLGDVGFEKLIICKDGQFPELLNFVFQNEISYDTLVILDHYIKLMDAWNTKIEDDFMWKEFYEKFKKYKPFFIHYAPLSDPHYVKVIKAYLTNST